MRDLKQEIVDILEPLVGGAMSRAILKNACHQLRIEVDREWLSVLDLPKVAPKIEASLSVFLGADRAGKLRAKIENLALED